MPAHRMESHAGRWALIRYQGRRLSTHCVNNAASGGNRQRRRLVSVPRRPSINRHDCISCVCVLFYDAKTLSKFTAFLVCGKRVWLFFFATKVFFQPVLTGDWTSTEFYLPETRV